MMSVEAVRAAVLSELPWEKLDGLVRAEMAAGRRVKEIAADFAAMSEAVWGTPGLPEDGRDAFGDTYDALTGNCHRDCCYYDPPITTGVGFHEIPVTSGAPPVGEPTTKG